MRYTMRFRQLGLVAAVLSLCAATPARAGISFTVSPMMSEIEVKPGTSHTGVFTVIHDLPEGKKADGVAPLNLRLYAADWSLDRKGNPQFVKAGTLPGSCSNWIQVSPTTVSVPAGERQEVRFTINVPAEAQGTFRTVIMFETIPEPPKNGERAIAINGRIGSTLYVLAGPQSRRARITGLSAAPEVTTLTVENTGTSHVRLKGVLQFKDAAGKMVQEVPLPGGVVLPGTNNIRELTVPMPAPLPRGHYTVTAIVDYGGEVLIGARSKVAVP